MGVFLVLVFATVASANIRDPENLIDNIKNYEPSWDDLDTRPLPEWYDKAKVGIFLHWGVFSVPSFGSEWFWANWAGNSTEAVNFMKRNYPPGFTYQEFAPMFKAEFFQPEKWARLFAKAGAKYVVLTSKHHEGFTLFPSKRSFSWNAVEVGPKRDLVKDLAEAVREEGLKFGVYHSLYEWFNPIYEEDKNSRFKSQHYVDTKLWPDLKQLVKNYEPSVIWADGDWEANDTYWRSTEFLAWLYNKSPVRDEVVVNDRWGIGIPGKHGDFYNYGDRFNPGKLMKHKWESAFTLDAMSWGYRRNMSASEVLTVRQLLERVISAVSCGGNVLINVGPTKEGTIAPIFEERLLQLGAWLGVNGEAVYGTAPWSHQNDSLSGDVWYTCAKQRYDGLRAVDSPRRTDNVTVVYAAFLQWPRDSVLRLKDITVPLHNGAFSKVVMLGNENLLNWKINSGIVEIPLPNFATVKSKYAWTLKFYN